MVIVIRPVVPRGGKDFFEEGGCIAIFQRSALRPLLWTPVSEPPDLSVPDGAPEASPSSSSSTSAPPATTTSTPAPPVARPAAPAPTKRSSTPHRSASPIPLRRTTGTEPRTVPVATAATPLSAAPEAVNIGASFKCICYEWTKGRTVAGTVAIWIGHGAKSTGPAHFPGILRFRQLAGFCLLAATERDPLRENMIRAATPPPINRILFLSCYALNWVTAHLPDFFAQIATPQNTDPGIDASNLKVHNGSIGEILRNLSDPRSSSVLARLKLTRAAELTAERFAIRLTVGSAYVYGPAMLEEVLINHTALIQRGWRTADPLVYLKFKYYPARSTRRDAAVSPPTEHRVPPLSVSAPG